MNPLTPVAVLVGRQSWMPKLLPVVVKVDTGLLKVSGGRLTLLRIAGLPNLFLTVPGRKSGVPRTTPLLCVPHEGRILIAGSYFGGPKLPVWVLNLRAAGAADIKMAGKEQHVTAREAVGEERDRLYDVMIDTWPNYRLYAERTEASSGRTIPVFELTPA
jgi:deazaflavin-dependent oxidoreductase (nitroreductase family)